MRCFIRQVGKNWHAAFDFAGVSYTHSLRTKSEKEAEVRIGVIRDTLFRLGNGTLSIPKGIDPKVYITSGGNVPSKIQAAPPLTIGQLADRYLASLQGVEENTCLTLTIHLNHFRRILKASTSLEAIQLVNMDRYARSRLKEQHHGRSISAYTVRKELRTFRRARVWASEHGHTTAPTWEVSSIHLPKDRGRERFRTYHEITTILSRGGMSTKDADRLWETMYLDRKELQEFLEYIREHVKHLWIYPMICMVAFTGCRRSEMIRSRIDDWDLDNKQVTIREKKRDTSKDYTTRSVGIHAELAKVMSDWFAGHPGGQHAITSDGHPLTVDTATFYFIQTLRPPENPHPIWSKIRGFHTLRHSLASILASKGVDQRNIDKIMGHQTEDMRKRYQHLFPKGVEDAISSLLG